MNEDDFAEGYYSYPEMEDRAVSGSWWEGYWCAHNELAHENGLEPLYPN